MTTSLNFEIIVVMKLRQRIKKLFKFGRTNMADAQVKNYTDEMVATMIDQYTATPTRATVDSLADEFGKTARSLSLIHIPSPRD